MMQHAGGQGQARCARCGSCTAVCPVYLAAGGDSFSPRAKIHLLSRLADVRTTRTMAGILSQCLLCGACTQACPQGINTPALVIRARGDLSWFTRPSPVKEWLVKTIVGHPSLTAGAVRTQTGIRRLLATLPNESGLWHTIDPMITCGQLDTGPPKGLGPLSSSDPDHPDPRTGHAYFPGCLASHLYPEIGTATQDLVRKTHGSCLHIPQARTCCGLAALSTGDLAQARYLAQKNIMAFAGCDGLPVLTSCASCYVHMRGYPGLFAEEPEWQKKATAFSERLVEFSTFFSQSHHFQKKIPLLSTGSSRPRRILYHDPCHLRFGPKIIDPPRKLLRALPDVQLLEFVHGPQCCGHGGLFCARHPELSARIIRRPLAEVAALAIDEVVTTCSGCLLQWRENLRKNRMRAQANHLAIFLRQQVDR